MPQFFSVIWPEDGEATVLGRITARNGTGAATGINGEGNFLQQGDLSTLTCAVYDLSAANPNATIATPAVTIGSAVLNTPVTSQADWTEDSTGYNFEHDLEATNFPTGGHIYLVEYTVTLTGGAVFHGRYKGPARRVRGT